ncbi:MULTISPECIES: DNA gyrase subunit A [unclassified Rhodanobacter]|uniref:DNA gyrase subunit A n=1 Tax=unclassified Rhodanobacter TaxID=2621553 RepID=UPI0007AA2ABF|nr:MULTISPECIES: DNA gyrase subunit A [unclassified Rhodanobacter]KZC17147.1 DNA gyrase subunit A [Rhodanobacter sp. FW104-R8]KZC28658.1 DNA gyrase subunit A [Rhodanobacter sp. FW510-T8]KZC29410.1 DNA gyrase subunit A [Rhodanobacter sp. FW510-R10]
MAELAKEVIRVNIEDEMRQSYLDYAMSVIVGRALPDVRDGLKPVHRRVLFAMNELGNVWNKPYKKSARVVGDVIGKYHPHGDQSVYDAIVRMAQPFSLRYLMVDGQGNFGSVDGDSAAAMRYTEVRMSRLTHELLADIDKETVDFGPNYDESEQEPLVLPTRVPNLLVNGSAGIAVGMATNIPPHNLNEVIAATIALIDEPSLSIDDLMHYIPGPDFPTWGIINGSSGIVEAYRTGRGRILVRAKAEIETEPNGRETIIVHELPYQVNKARLIEKIAELVKEKKLEGISELRDESDKDGMRVVIEIRKDAMGDVVLNNLFQQTQLQVTFGINMVALLDGQPKLLNLKDILEAFIRHRREVVTRRTIFELRKARARAHILEGLTVALANIDEMIELIKTSASPAEARERMLARKWQPGMVGALLSAAGAGASRPEDMDPRDGLKADGYQLSDVQAQEILAMRLHRLTGLEQEKLSDEYRQILETIRGLIEILENPNRLLEVIREELEVIKAEFGDARRTEIQHSQEDLNVLDLIAPEDVVVTLSHTGYVKRQPASTYRAQKRGGKGRSASALKDEDFVEQLWVVNTHDTLLTFTSTGRVYWLKVYQMPDAGPGARGKPIINLLPLAAGEKVQAVLPVREYTDDRYVFFATKHGTVKKTPLTEFAYQLQKGKQAIKLDEGDALVNVELTDGNSDILLFASNGKVNRFDEDTVRSMGRTATGVRGMRLAEGAQVVSLIVAAEGDILTATERGYGKRTQLDEFPKKGRGTQGVIGIQCSERNGALVAAVQVTAAHELMLISNQGTLVRTRVAEVSQLGRNTQGVTLIRLPADETLVSVVRLEADEDNGEEAESADMPGPADDGGSPAQAGE